MSLYRNKEFWHMFKLIKRAQKRITQKSLFSSDCSRKWPSRIFSGIQPTGCVHLGNYFGAIQKWVELQNTGHETIYSIVDLHSITLPQKPADLRNSILNVTATLLACGIDPVKSVLFQQSKVPLHAELCWVLGCSTTMPRLGQLPQFKEKSSQMKNIPLGLYIYPVLQTADILLYRATHVPIGEDQIQHMQLARHLAHNFNSLYGETFPIPQDIMADMCVSRLRSLRDPMKKMSKSDTDYRSRIELTDSDEEILKKCKKAVTDFTSEVTYEPDKRPGVANLILIHSLFSGKLPEEICQECSTLDTSQYKLVVAKIVQENLKPIREKVAELMTKPQFLEEILYDGAQRALKIAEKTWKDVCDKVGF